MNKKILTAAVGAALLAGPLAAQADMKLSGRVAADLVSIDGVLQYADYGQSRLQFDIMDDSGLYARAATDTRGWFQGSYNTGRDFYAGFKGSWGSLQAGRMGGAVKNIEKDPFIATFLELRNNAIRGGKYGSSGFIGNMLQYANSFNGLNLKVQYNLVDTTVDPNGGDLGASLTGKFGNGGFYAGYNTEEVSGNTYYKVGGDMTFSGIKVKLGYQSLDTGTTNSNFLVGAEFGLGDGQMIEGTYADKGSNRNDAFYRIAYQKKFSKNAEAHVGYVNNGAGAGNVGTYGGGLIVRF
jgi:hypothetical protein